MDLVRDNPTALYRQIVAVLQNDIAGGNFGPSGRLPAELEIAASFNVSRVTVRLALAQLERDGLIERRKGKGTFVAGNQVRYELDTLRSFHESLIAQKMNATMRIIDLEQIPTPPEIRPDFGVAAQTCLLLRRLHLVDGEPIALAYNYLPGSMAALSPRDAQQSPIYAILGLLTGQAVASARVSIGAIEASQDLAKILQVAKKAALLLLERTSHFADERCAEKSVFYIRPERYRFVLRSPTLHKGK